MRETGRGIGALRLALATALGLIALLALPSLAAAKAKDRNHDGIPDRWEKRYHLSLNVNEAHRNPDHEGLDNREEFENGTNPRRADTDRDGLTDSQEIEIGDDPNDRDSDGDGIEDGEENAGTIVSFDGTTLTIHLFGGGTLSGEVTDATQCEEVEVEHASHGGRAHDSSESGGENEDEFEEEEEEEEEEPTCTTSNLRHGALVQQAELEEEFEEEGEEGAADFSEIVLVD